MAECSLYGGLVPNSYIDKVFIEEALVDTNNDGIIDLETPKISINIRLVDELSSNGTFALLEEALEVQMKLDQSGFGNITFFPAQEVNLKEYFNIWCVVSDSEQLTEELEDLFERRKNEGSFSWTIERLLNPNLSGVQSEFKSLNDAISTYENSDGTTQIIIPYSFDLDTNKPVEHLSIFTYVQLNTAALEADFNLALPESFKNPVSRFEEELVIQNSVVNPELRIFLTEGGEIWNGAVHIHLFSSGGPQDAREIYMEGATHISEPHGVLQKTSAPINNVQDFRIRDEINVLFAEFENLTTLQNTFPGQQEILNRTISKNSYFSEISITKDENRDIRFLFAFDYGKYVLENSKYSSLISKMTETARKTIMDNSQIVQFILSKTQVKQEPARNNINSPVQNFVLSDDTPTTPVILSLDDTNLTEIDLILSNQTEPLDTFVRYFTGVDTDLKSDGIYQYDIDIEIIDGFISLMDEIYKNAATAAAEYQKYVVLTQIPNVYDPEARKFTPDGITILSDATKRPFGPDPDFINLEAIVESYLSALSYFVDVGTVPLSRESGIPLSQFGTVPLSQYGGLTQKDFFKLKVLNLISPTNGTVDGVILFGDLLNLLLAQINNIMSVGHSSGGVEDTLQNQPSSNTSVFKLQTMRLTEDFDNTIDSRFINETYVDNISGNKTRTFAGLTIYSFSELSNASQTLFPQPVEFTGKSLQELLDEQAKQEETLASKGINIVFQSEGEYLQSAKNFQVPQKGNSTLLQNQFKGATNYLGESSNGALSNLNVSNVSPQDLFVETTNDKLRGQEVTLGFNNFVIASLPSEEEPLEPVNLQTEVEVLTVFGRPSKVNLSTFGSMNWGYNFMLRDTSFETKQLGELTTFPVLKANTYYLCRQVRQGDIDVIDSFFLLRPETTFDATPEITQEGVQLDLQQPVAETVLEQVAEVTNPSNMTQEGVQLNFGSGDSRTTQVVLGIENILAKNSSKTGRNPIDTTSSSRTETNTDDDNNGNGNGSSSGGGRRVSVDLNMTPTLGASGEGGFGGYRDQATTGGGDGGRDELL
jgi:hypothetical protein